MHITERPDCRTSFSMSFRSVPLSVFGIDKPALNNGDGQ
jgi:hypothetical protein